MIPGITDRPRLPRLGKIRLGEKAISKGGKEYPKALSHFSFVDVPEIEAIYGKAATVIYPVLLPHDDEDIWFPTARKAYRASGLFCACDDGQTATRVYAGKDEKGAERDEQGAAYIASVPGLAVEEGEYFDMPCPAEECPFMIDKHCKNVGRLMVILPNVPKWGVYEVTTSSRNGMINVLNYARSIKYQVGRVTGIPFALVLKPIQVQPEGKKKTVYALDLEYRGNIYDLARLGKRLESGGIAGLLPETGEAVPDDLMPRGGHGLDDKLHRRPQVKMPEPTPARTVQAEVVEEAPHDPSDLGPELTGDPDEPGSHDGPEPEIPIWQGQISRISKTDGPENKWTLWRLYGADGRIFGTFSKTMQAVAVAHGRKGGVRITYKHTDKGDNIETIEPIAPVAP